MAYTVKLLISDQNTIESALKDYLDSAGATTIHNISTFVRGCKIYALITWE